MRKLWSTRKLRLTWVLAVGATAVWAQADPPSRVARLNILEGTVSYQAANQEEWSAATLNYPLTTGDRLWADENSRAEMHIGSAAIRLDAHTAIAFLNLDDRMTQVRLSDGTINVTIRHLESDESYEVDTPNGAVTLLRPGKYRFDADPDRQITTVTVREGEAEITAGDRAFPVHARQSAFITGAEQPNTEIAAAGRMDGFDNWWQNRDDREDRRPPPRYVSREMNGYEDLDDNGTWRDEPGYGPVWAPRTVVAGWAPYRYGHWAMVEPWGWTWIDDAPWGFAPFHYGRWAYIRGSWGWCPGAVVVRPVYAPALVAFVGGNNWGVSLSFGGGGGVGWFPLGPREVYRPAYRVSETYVRQVNITNVTNVTNITNVNVTNVHYVNQNVPNAVTAVSRTDFVSARPVGRAAVAVPQREVASAQVVGTAPAISRQQAREIARPERSVAVVRPPQTVMSTPVVTKIPPPPATRALARPTPAQPTAARPTFVQPTNARPTNVETNRPSTATPPTPRVQPTPNYRPPTAEPNRPATVEPANRPPTQAAQPVQPNRPATPERDYRQPTQPNRPAAPERDYRPPTQPTQPNRPAPPQQAQPQSEPHYHGSPNTPNRPQQQERRAAPADRPHQQEKPSKEKEKAKPESRPKSDR